jgi:hypothetical protein
MPCRLGGVCAPVLRIREADASLLYRVQPRVAGYPGEPGRRTDQPVAGCPLQRREWQARPECGLASSEGAVAAPSSRGDHNLTVSGTFIRTSLRAISPSFSDLAAPSLGRHQQAFPRVFILPGRGRAKAALVLTRQRSIQAVRSGSSPSPPRRLSRRATCRPAAFHQIGRKITLSANPRFLPTIASDDLVGATIAAAPGTSAAERSNEVPA